MAGVGRRYFASAKIVANLISIEKEDIGYQCMNEQKFIELWGLGWCYCHVFRIHSNSDLLIVMHFCSHSQFAPAFALHVAAFRLGFLDPRSVRDNRRGGVHGAILANASTAKAPNGE